MLKTAAVLGTDAVAEAMRQIEPDVVSAYPITPQTSIVEAFSEMVANGKVHTEMINVESEHSAMSSCIGAAAAGARVMTATSSQGLALMWELLYVASGLRLPIIMPNVNRSLSAPINIHCDHSDSMGARDAGWMQMFCENVQESYDNTIQAVRIAENKKILLPIMINLDGFIISHRVERVEYCEDEEIRSFVGSFNPDHYLLDPDHPVSIGNFDTLGGYYYEFKRAQEEAMCNALHVIEEVGREFGDKFGRYYGLFEEHFLEDARVALVAAGSAAGTTAHVVREMREKGLPVGLLKLRVFRPFPAKALQKALAHVPVIGVMDRSLMFAGEQGGPIFSEMRSAFYDLENRPRIFELVYGLGGRDLGTDLVENACRDLLEGRYPEGILYLGLREGDVI